LVDSTCGKIPSLTAPQTISVRRFVLKVKSSETRECTANVNDNANSRRDFLGLTLGVSTLFIHSFDAANGAGLPPEEKPKLCDDTCEKELENVW
jgi:peptidylprolyl isomerase